MEFHSRRDRLVALLLGLLCLVVYNANLRPIGSGDTLSARYLPFAIWHSGTVLFDPLAETAREGHADSYWLVAGPGGHWLSLYPVTLPVLVAPLYAPAAAYLHVRGWTEARLERVATVMEKATASLLAAAASVLVYFVLRRRAPPGDALLLAVAFAFGTETWMIGSQALWQHGLAELLLAGVLLLLMSGPPGTGRALAVGLLCGLVVANRPPDALVVAPLGLYSLVWAGRRWPWLVLAAIAPLVPVVAYNLVYAGKLGGAYELPKHGTFFQFGFAAGVAGMLVSPARGLLVFSPFLLFVPAGFRRGLRDPQVRYLTLAAGCGALALLLFFAKADWRAGRSWGPRWLTEALPLLVFLLPPALAALRGVGRAVFVALVAASIAVQAIGAFWYTGASEEAIFAPPPGLSELRACWDPANTPFLVELRHARAPFHPSFQPWRPYVSASGFIDRLESGGAEVVAVAAGTPVAAEGWAVVDGHPPSAVELAVDGQPRGVAASFFDREDVRQRVYASGPLGWRAQVDTAGLAPGAHIVTAEVRYADGAASEVGRHLLVITPGGAAAASGRGAAPAVGESGAADGDLAANARLAVTLLLRHQQPAGYWLTQYAGEPRFTAPHAEMNTYLTAMLVDLLTPLAARPGLDGSVARARAHLAAQIEASGLVRYHGLPDAPTIATLGCPITPDADDTALVWRLSGRAPEGLRPRALKELARYRTPEGLYRTWLAPVAHYVCI
ncbi:MAG TPA: hypothetical protein VGE98_12700, partial [Thermoanaerobaculia bacterium]